MKTVPTRRLRRSLLVTAAGILAVALTGCSAHGGGQLEPDVAAGFTGPATFGFSFSCERSSNAINLHPKTGQFRVQLNYRDHGSNPIGAPFAIHGIVDELDPILESMICIGDEPPPVENVLSFMGRFRLVGPAPEGFPATCPEHETDTTPMCRFEVIVRDDDMDGTGDHFEIRLSTQTKLGELATVFYTRAGVISKGHITLD